MRICRLMNGGCEAVKEIDFYLLKLRIKHVERCPGRFFGWREIISRMALWPLSRNYKEMGFLINYLNASHLFFLTVIIGQEVSSFR